MFNEEVVAEVRSHGIKLSTFVRDAVNQRLADLRQKENPVLSDTDTANAIATLRKDMAALQADLDSFHRLYEHDMEALRTEAIKPIPTISVTCTGAMKQWDLLHCIGSPAVAAKEA